MENPTKEQVFFAKYWENKYGRIQEINPSDVCDIMKLYAHQQAKEMAIEMLKWIAERQFYTHNDNCYTSREVIGTPTYTSEQLSQLFIDEKAKKGDKG